MSSRRQLATALYRLLPLFTALLGACATLGKLSLGARRSARAHRHHGALARRRDDGPGVRRVQPQHVPYQIDTHGGRPRPRGDTLWDGAARAAARPLAGEPQPRGRAHAVRVGGDGRRGTRPADKAGGGVRARREGDPGYATRRRDGGAEGQGQRTSPKAGAVTGRRGEWEWFVTARTGYTMRVASNHSPLTTPLLPYMERP